ncbi:hypothetical protein PENSPDRAFT_690449 [Peniophora sp. CONT]|nr:hypothetical protein PENSPDRAFT_690449 [Peniophora sp. CONT]
MTRNAAREVWRDHLSAAHPAVFPRRGANEVYVDKLVDWTLYGEFDWQPEVFPMISCTSASCEMQLTPPDYAERRGFPTMVVSTPTIELHSATPVRLDAYIAHLTQGPVCAQTGELHALQCDGSARIHTSLVRPAAVICINACYHTPDALDITEVLDLPVATDMARYRLRGVIYHGVHHFTCRFVFEGSWWVYDGADAAGHALREGSCQDPALSYQRFGRLNGRRAYKLVYALDV